MSLPRLLDAYDEHQALLKEQETLKRRAENGYGLGQPWGFSALSLRVLVSLELTGVSAESLHFSPLKCDLNRAVLP